MAGKKCDLHFTATFFQNTSVSQLISFLMSNTDFVEGCGQRGVMRDDGVIIS